MTTTTHDSAIDIDRKCFTCHDCGETNPIPTDGTGYGLFDDVVVCYKCAGTREEQAMKDTGKATLYMVFPDCDDARPDIVNWCGTLRFMGYKYWTGSHNWASRVHYVRFVGPDGYWWSGKTVGDNTQICHCRRTRKKTHCCRAY